MRTYLKRIYLHAGLASCWLLAAGAFGQTGYSITGGMSNFDCHNQCDDPCDEFEIEIDDCRPENITGTWRNGNYGSPSVLLSSDGTFTIIDYHSPAHPTAVGAVEHFGVSLRQLTATNNVRVRWMRNGAPATVNGHVPLPGGGSAPNTQPLLPTISAEMATGSVGQDGVSLSVTNNDASQWIWITRRAQISTGTPVTLGQLMPNDPVVTSTVPIDNAPITVAPGQTLTLVSDLVEAEDNQSVVFAAQYFQDLGITGPFNNTHTRGPELGNIMTAAIASPGTGCEYSHPTIVRQPASTNAAAGGEVALQVDADGNDLPLTYQWMKDGATLSNTSIFHGVTTDELSITSLTAATEGFYAVRVSNGCGDVVSESALVFITGHNQVFKPLGALVDPASMTVAPGDSILITGNCAFVPAGSTFAWKHNGVALTEGAGGASVDGGFVTGASGPADSLPVTLSIDGVQPLDAGSYTITFSNGAGSATSNSATVTVTEPCGLSIDTQPSPSLICLGGTAAFQIGATGTDPVNYEWQLETDPDVWFALGQTPVSITCGGANGEAFAAPSNSPIVDLGVSGCAGYFNIRCVVTDACGTLASDPTLILVLDCTPCPADFNQDGGVDGADVAAFFGAWEAGDPSADVNFDGGVDGADVQTFFTAWENGGC